MKIIIIGSKAERRAGLKTLLRQVRRQTHFNEVCDLNNARDAARERGRPDMFVIDWAQGLKPIDLHELTSVVPGVPIAVMIDQPTIAQVFVLLAVGAAGIIPRSLAPALIVRALDMVMIGGHYIPPDIFNPELGRELLPRRSHEKHALSPTIRPGQNLSLRQQQIMRCLHMGSTNKVIAKILGISEGTVKVHLAGIFQQLGATNRAAAIAIYNGVQASHLQILRSDETGPDAATATHAEADAPSEQVSEDGGNSVAGTNASAAHAVETANTAGVANATGAEDTAGTANAAGAEDTAVATTEPVHETNVIQMRGKCIEYPSRADDDTAPLPMAAEPQPTAQSTF
jgi:DNA-binding NarL/FixJ family response regulator